jgi:DNA-directed RNA polymerase specialized sigma24 family protein
MTRPGARTDAELVQDFLTGNSAALGDLYDRFAPGLYDTAAAMLRDRDGASDVVQDVFCVAATKLGQLRDPTRVKPWLYAIARHEIFRRTKQRSRSTSLDALGDEFGMDPIASPIPTPTAPPPNRRNWRRSSATPRTDSTPPINCCSS